MEIEAIVMKLKSLGYREEDILDIHVDGRPVPSVKTICETRTALQYASKVLGGGGRAQDSTTSGSSNTKPTTTPTASIAGRRAIGDQGGVQSAQLGSRVIAAGMVTPQQQQQSQHGGVTKVVTPHQFGLTPFPSMSYNVIL